MSTLKYRPEIDGLRALAVIPVLLFHAGVPGFGGGYVGVDIFFVISGYLITGILLKDLRRGTFSLLNFYERRARRILPALYLVIFCTIPMAWLVMMPSQLKDFSQSLVAISGFAANIFFYLKSGYFEPASELNPMLHIWSLAVEEQFYFIFPLFLMLFFRRCRRAVVPLILLLSAVSFYRSQALLATDPAGSFFLPFGRAWELMIGGLINFMPRQEDSGKFTWKLGAWLGTALIVASIVWLNEHSPFPGLLAVPSTIGAALVIYCASGSSGVGRILAFRPVVGIGLISYSTYLWHQPLFAVARMNTLGEPPLYLFFLLIALSIGLAYLTWRFVERPFRNNKSISRKALAIACALAVTLVMAIGVSGHKTKGFAEIKYSQAGEGFRDFDNRLMRLRKERVEFWKESIEMGSASDFSDREDTLKVLVVGDSRSEDLYVSLTLNGERFSNAEFRLQRLDELCFPALANLDVLAFGTCEKQVEAFIQCANRIKADLILVSCGWLDDGDEQLEYLLEYLNGKPCVVFGTASFDEIDSQFWAIHRLGIPQSEWSNFFTENVHVRSRDASQKLKRVTDKYGCQFINTYEIFEINSNDEAAEPVYNLTTDDGDPLLIDQTHLTIEGAKRFGKAIFEKDWLQSKR